ncbi:L-aspartate oxidase [Alkalicoccus daliensis]|uniref:L-aspartate oxidase n=1 Tax=Alkalicoccus daliensis TaxID=745820 RepID=A0A1H0DQ06_9BACI|nr:L-aspartate oxidase [Alkalicoccus daliensis]SDN72235.1 L-aspartate oxidase [Alkalicoccus daliensis]
MHKIYIAGGGAAALTAANYLAEYADVTLIMKGKRNRGNSWLAQGGIAGAVSPEDSLKSHVQDTMKAGCFLNDLQMVKDFIKEGRELLQELEQAGSLFDRDNEGNVLLGKEGAHSFPRVLHAGGDQTGRKLMEFLTSKLNPAVSVMEDTMVMDLLTEKGQCRGLIVQDKQNVCHWLKADAVILATGGIGGLFLNTSNDIQSTGDGLAMAWRSGVKLQDLEYIQFHPTLLAGGRGLITEAIRGAGAELILEDGERLMKHIPGGSLAARDVVAREVFRHTLAGKKVYLDISNVPHFKTRFPQVAKMCMEEKIILENGKIPVETGAHFHMGGIQADKWGRTSLNNLYAIGETACTSVHGANRLASNSLLEALVFARRCALVIKNNINEKAPINREKFLSFRSRENKAELPEKQEIKNKVTEALGVIRDSGKLREFLKWSDPYLYIPSLAASPEVQEKRNMIISAHIICEAALKNTESLGAHFRADSTNTKEKVTHELN